MPEFQLRRSSSEFCAMHGIFTHTIDSVPQCWQWVSCLTLCAASEILTERFDEWKMSYEMRGRNLNWDDCSSQNSIVWLGQKFNKFERMLERNFLGRIVKILKHHHHPLIVVYIWYFISIKDIRGCVMHLLGSSTMCFFSIPIHFSTINISTKTPQSTPFAKQKSTPGSQISSFP